MADRISSPTAIPDLFGPGKNGFGLGPPTTALNPPWFNGVQEAVVRTIEYAGLVPDALDFDQFTNAIASFPFLNPNVTGDLTITNGARILIVSGGLSCVQTGGAGKWENGSTLVVESNVTFFWADNTIEFGSTVANDWTVHGEVTLCTDGTNTLTILAGTTVVGTTGADTFTVNAVSQFNENVTLEATKLLTAKQIDAIDNAGYLAAGEVRFYEDTNPAFTQGFLQWDGSDLRLGATGVAHIIPSHRDGWVAGDVATVNAIDNTGASASLVMRNGESCIVTMSMETSNNTVGLNINMRIEANAVIIGGSAQRYQPSLGGVYQTATRTVQYTAGVDATVVFLARHGAVAGTTTSRNIHITARRIS